MTEVRTARRYNGDPRDTVRFWGEGTRPTVCVWEITLKCNLACKHCGSRAGSARSDELSTTEALKTVHDLREAGIKEVILIGGEAYLRDDWFDIACEITRIGMRCTMVTGGYQFDAFHLQEALAAGIEIIGISIDGIGATHDHLRGRIGSFESAIKTAQLVKSSGVINLTINSQINALSMPELFQLAELVVKLGASAWQLQVTVALGRAADRPKLLMQPYQMRELLPILSQIKSDILEPANVQLFPGNNIGYFGMYERQLRYGGTLGYEWQGCMAGRAALGIEADGTLKGCPSLPTEDYGGGSVRDRSVLDMWLHSEKITALGRRTVEDLWGFCRSCKYAAQCLAGCTWTSHALFGKPGNNPYCYHRADTLAKRGVKEVVQQVEAAPGKPFDFGRYKIVEVPFDEAGEGALLKLAQALFTPSHEGFWSKKGLKAHTSKASLRSQRSDL